MHKHLPRILSIVLLIGLFGLIMLATPILKQKQSVMPDPKTHYWFELQRKSQIEYLYQGIPGDKANSKLVKTFTVKTGIPGERPTPLPQLLGRDFWIITHKQETKDDPQTAPFFLTLNVPISEEEPFGPSPYLECEGQCDWVRPGAFGLHGINNDRTKLSSEDSGSSGCVRHTDEDITYLYKLLDPKKEEIRYYIIDS